MTVGRPIAFGNTSGPSAYAAHTADDTCGHGFGLFRLRRLKIKTSFVH